MFPAGLVMAAVSMDIATTLAALSSGITEKNPVPAFLSASFGLWQFMAFKFLIILAVVALLTYIAVRRTDQKMQTYIRYGLWLIFVVYGFVVAENLQAVLFH